MSRRITRLAAALAIASWACAPSCGPGPVPSAPTGDDLRGAAGSLDAVGRSLRAEGFAPGPRVEGDLRAGMSVTLSLSPQADGRVVAVAVGEPVELSLDLRALDGASGREISSDVSRGRRAAASFAVRRGGTYQVTALAASGSGRAALAVFEAPLETPPPRLVGLFDGDSGSRPGWPAITEALAADGYAPSAEPVDFEVDENARRTFGFRLAAGGCYRVVALGSPGVDSLALRLLDGAELLSGDFARRYEAWTETCPEADVDARASVTAVAGTGTVRLGLFVAPRDRVAPRVGPPLGPASGPRTAESGIRVEGARLSRRGYAGGVILATFGDLAAGERRAIALPEGLDGCYALVAAADGGADGIELRLTLDASDAGTAVCHGRGVIPRATLFALRQTGSTAVALHRLPGREIPPGRVDADVAFHEVAARFAREGLGELLARFDLTPCGGGHCGSLRLEGGRCYGAVALPRGGRVTRLEARARGGEGSEGAGAGGDGISELAWCPGADVDAEFTAVLSGAGPLPPSIAVFTEPGASP